MAIARAYLVAASVTLAMSVGAAAAPIDLSLSYGSGRGCAYRIDQAYSEEPMVLLTSSEIATAASQCSFTVSETMKDGSLKLSATCAEEGEGETSPATFSIKAGAEPGALVILDENDNVFAEVNQCE